jgi:hypothetical protein
VENLGAFAFEPRAFACGHDCDGEAIRVHTGIWSHEGCGQGIALREKVVVVPDRSMGAGCSTVQIGTVAAFL